MTKRNLADTGLTGFAGKVSRGLYDKLQAELSDEAFLVAMGNRLRELEQARAAPAALRWIKRSLLSMPEETSLPGLDLKRLLLLAGQDLPERIENDRRYPVDHEQLHRLVDAARARQADKDQNRETGN